MTDRIQHLVRLSREIGREDRQLAILAEGNTSARLASDRFAVKASGASLANLNADDVTVCDFERTLALLERKNMSDEELETLLMEARADGSGKKPSVEAVFHAWLLKLKEVEYVGHCHSLSANQVLCSPRARDFAERRLFPDEVVCCGRASVFVPYSDPGLPLAREIGERTRAFMEKEGYVPRLILLQNHGLIALGATAEAVLACLLMADKAAAVFMGAAAMGGPNFMTAQHVDRIASRPDEAYRQRELNLAPGTTRPPKPA